jgi:hypothetical protein
VNAQHDDYAIAGVDELRRVPAPALPAALPIGLPAQQSLEPSVLRRVGNVVVAGFDLRLERAKSSFTSPREKSS